MPLAIALALALLALPAIANDEAPKTQPRDGKAAATEKGTKDAPAEGSQQNKMKRCNAEAGRKDLKGDERRSFMSACLKGH
jgi:hypothetical protein